MTRFQSALLLITGILILGLTVIYTGNFWPDFGDTDTYTRIAYLTKSGWGEITHPLFSRDGAPDGLLLEWTLPFNSISMLMGKLMGWDLTREISGFIFLLFLALAAWWNTKTLGSKFAKFYILPLISYFPVILVYAQPYRLTHHVMTAVFCLLATGMSLQWWRKPTYRHAVFAGISVSLMLWESMETIPVLYMCWGILLSGILSYPKRAKGINGFLVGSVVTMSIALTIDGPWGYFPVFSPFRLSLLHLFMVISVGLSLIMAKYSRSKVQGQINLKQSFRFIVYVSKPIFIPLLFCPFMGIELHNKIFDTYFWNSIGELTNIFKSPDLIITSLSVCIFVLFGWLWVCYQKPRSLIRWMLFLMLFCSIIMGAIYLRMALYPQMLSIILGSMMLGKLFCGLLPRNFHSGSKLVFLDKTGFKISLILNGFLIILSIIALITVTPKINMMCEADYAFSKWLEHNLPPKPIVMGDIWISPSLLYSSSNLRTVGGPYHGNPKGIEDVANFMTTTDATIAYKIFNQRKAVAVVICGNENFVKSNTLWPNNSMASNLAKGRMPEWMDRLYPPSDIHTSLLVFIRK